MLKKLLIAAGALAALAIVGVVVLLGNLDGIIKSGVEKVGSEATQTAVTVGAVKLEITSGSGQVDAIKIANPAGFKTEHAFYLGRIRLQVDPASIGSNPIVIKDITIEDPQVIYELDGSMSTNLGAIKESVAAFTKRASGGSKKKSGGGKPAEQSSEEKPAGEATKIIIEKLNFSGGRVAVSASFLEGKDVGADLPALHMTDIGKAEGGLTGEEVGGVILKALTDNALETAKKIDLDKWLKDSVIDKVGGAIKGIFGK
jgi:hypothetical protein